MENKSDYVPPNSGTYRIVKVTLIVLQALNIIRLIILVAVGWADAVSEADREQQQKGDIIGRSSSGEQQIPKVGIGFYSAIIVFVTIILIVITVMGLYGALKEKFGFVLAYGVIFALSAFGGFSSGFIWTGIFNLIGAGVSFYFAYLIRSVRSQYVA